MATLRGERLVIAVVRWQMAHGLVTEGRTRRGVLVKAPTGALALGVCPRTPWVGSDVLWGWLDPLASHVTGGEACCAVKGAWGVGTALEGRVTSLRIVVRRGSSQGHRIGALSPKTAPAWVALMAFTVAGASRSCGWEFPGARTGRVHGWRGPGRDLELACSFASLGAKGLLARYR
jgi:hypothetical protein